MRVINERYKVPDGNSRQQKHHATVSYIPASFIIIVRIIHNRNFLMINRLSNSLIDRLVLLVYSLSFFVCVLQFYHFY